MNTQSASRSYEQRPDTLRLQLRYRDGRFDVCNHNTNEIEGHVIVDLKSTTATYIFISRKPYSKHAGATIRQALQSVYGRDFQYTIESIL